MAARIHKQRTIYIYLITILIVTSTCQLFSFGREDEISRKEEAYEIDPDIILEKLNQGETNVFRLQTETPDAVVSTSITPVDWSQSDFLQIADALHKFVWNETLVNWSLVKMIFGLDCNDANHGPQYAYFSFYNVMRTNQQETRAVHDIYILHQPNSVSWTEIEYYPKLQDWQSINLDQVKVSASDALEIAEKNGGADARFSVNNQCSVVLILAPGSEFNGWQVSYSGNSGLFRIMVDPFTANFQLMKPSP